jgi:sulfate transport system permease protein
VVTWVLVRYRFPWPAPGGRARRLPVRAADRRSPASRSRRSTPRTAGSGAPLERLGIKVAFTPLGITLALTFIGLPFVVRTLQPVLESLDPEVEEAAASLGANRLQVIARVVLPALFPAWLTGFALAFARGLGEYGSVVFIAGNMPMRPRSRRS